MKGMHYGADDSDSDEEETRNSVLCMCMYIDRVGQRQHMCDEIDDNFKSACVACCCCRLAVCRAALCGAGGSGDDATARRADACRDRLRVPCPGGALRVNFAFCTAFTVVAALHYAPIHPVAAASALLLTPVAWIGITALRRAQRKGQAQAQVHLMPSASSTPRRQRGSSLFLRGWTVASYLIAALLFAQIVQPELLRSGVSSNTALAHTLLVLFVTAAWCFHSTCASEPGAHPHSYAHLGARLVDAPKVLHKCAFIGGRHGGAIGPGNESVFLAFLTSTMALCVLFAYAVLVRLQHPPPRAVAHAYYLFLTATSAAPICAAQIVRRLGRRRGE